MSKKFLIANWKMKLNVKESIQLAKDLKLGIAKAKFSKDKEIVIAPDFLSWREVAKIFKNSKVNMASQNAWYEDRGSFTGEISLAMLKDLDCRYVILGHSERRAFSGENDELINKKVATALRHNITPIVCVGETFDQRKEGRKDVVIMQQVQAALKGIDILPEQTLIIAYEPVWAIGSGQAMKPVEAEHTALVIKQSLIDVLEHQDLPLVKVIYGGSVNSKNISSFIDIQVIDGALIGGASLNAKEFISLIKKA